MAQDSSMVDLQAAARAKLAADPAFDAVPVLTESLKDVESELLRALGPQTTGASGVVAIVITPKFKVSSPNVPGPWFDKVRLVVRIMENVTVNQQPGGTGKPALMLVRAAARVLHQYFEAGIFAPLSVLDAVLVPDHDTENGAGGNLIYDLNLETSLNDLPGVNLAE